MVWRIMWVWGVWLMMTIMPTTAQESLDTVALLNQQTVLYSGAGSTFEPVTTLPAGTLVSLLGRNRLGNWLHVGLLEAGNADFTTQGWVRTQALFLRPTVNVFRDVPENWWVGDGDPTRIPNIKEAQLYLYPIMPRLSESMKNVYAYGQTLGNNPNVITRIGDSLINSEWYLLPMAWQNYQLAEHGYLLPALQQFGGQMTASVAVQNGLSTYTVQEALWADKRYCLADETPLVCEIRLRRPMASFISFGPNDVKNGTLESYRQNLTAIIEYCLSQGVIPILMTFSSHPSHPFYERTLEYNATVGTLAQTYEVPLINVWLATRELPNYGLEVDLIHLKNSGYPFLNFGNGTLERSGVAVLNWLSLRFMEELRVQLALP